MSFAKLVLGLRPGAGKVTPIVVLIMIMIMMVMMVMVTCGSAEVPLVEQTNLKCFTARWLQYCATEEYCATKQYCVRKQLNSLQS